MMKKILWKEVLRSISKSKGRFLSIMGLMLLSSFALVGLKVTGPDMRDTGRTYVDDLNSADITVISSLGLDQTDEQVLNTTKNLKELEYGYMKDVTINDSHKSIRLYSKGKNLSDYSLVDGRLPKKENEIAIDEMQSDKYKIGETIVFDEEAKSDAATVLKRHEYKIVGFVHSSEILSNINMGQSTSGSGELKGYGVVSKENFDSPYYMLARMSFKNTQGVDPYSEEYTSKIKDHKDDLEKLLEEQPTIRLAELKKEYQDQINDGQRKIDEAKKQLLDSKNQLAALNLVPSEETQRLTEEFAKRESEVAEKISVGEEKIAEAQEIVNNLKAPVYSLNTRREIPGSEGYRTYSTVSKIVDALANIFPIFLYFVAALVTSTTMARFVDEERINSGTLKALGYSNRDILKKFTFYGLSSSLIGTFIGVLLGHILLPMIVYNAYHNGFVFQNIELHFNLKITIVAVCLSIFSSVIPAWLVASKELKDQPANLLLPKPPAAGSKIFLERITFIWSRMTFTHKVTARNIFRYKKRMFMTIFGVAGAVTLLFAGFSVQHSIDGISNRQFGDIIHYDMIIVENNTSLAKQKKEVAEQLNTKAIKESAAIHFENMTKAAGKNNDTQNIKLLVPVEKEELSSYIDLENRESGRELELPDDGVIITERLAKLLKVNVGDTITLNDEDGHSRKMNVHDITEMYMGHFAFTSKEGYEKIFHHSYEPNAFVINLSNRSLSNTEKQAENFMNLDGVKAVVQNTSLINQVHTIVNSLNKIMRVLIIVAALLGIVILYNLTNINVSERMRELSTIKVLGFYDKEVTMYIYRETILLTTLGVIVGFGIGEFLHQYIIAVVPPDEVMFNPALGLASFLVPAAIIALVTLLLGFMVNYRLRNVDMLEALKSVE